ncbi:unnamed protein product [Microthlaspi erraticum]|uniref:NB-ARC domain-containing protein n=1 Tax=Microthlaspi erraticum TaxID=1685480 RepID=A0A6D2IEU4_9BRAS|nr:unnamed protein product [Microthlaspi erraticum]
MDSHGIHQIAVVKACENILESLNKDTASRVILVGEAGIGKTWLARKICEHATGEEGSCYITLWLNLNRDLDEMSLYKNIASQLSLSLENEEDEEDDSDEDGSKEEEDERTQYLMRLKHKIHQKLKRKKLKGKGKKYPLLVLDDEGSPTKEGKVMKDLHLRDFLAPYRPLKILLTRRKTEEDAMDSDGEIESHLDKSQALRDILSDEYLVDLLESLISEESRSKLRLVEDSWGTNHELLRRHIVRMSMRSPAALVVLAKSLNYICQTRSFLFSLEEVFKIADHPLSFQSGTATGREGAATDRSRENPILRLSYELLESADTKKIPVVDCFWHSLSFFEHCGCVYYQELIAHWILEGYIDPVKSVENAYKDGHNVMMELIKCGLLKIEEDNVVMPEVAMKNLIHLQPHGSGTSRIGLAKVCGGDMKKGLGRINQEDGVIEGVRGTGKGKKITTVLVNGNRLCRETPKRYFEKLGDVEVLGVFEPKLDPFVSFLSKLVKLRVLVIRGCDQLEDIEELKALQGLRVLEVSGGSSLKIISDGFFMAMSELRSIRLSGLQIKSSPSSISLLKKLRRLIIRDCTVLEDLPDIQELGMLEVVDVSGARGLETCFDKGKKNKSKNQNFYHLQQLQLLDLSESQIDRLPIFQDAEVAAKLHSLAWLLLRNCRKLVRLPNLKPLSGLQVLDLSGSTSLGKILEVCFEDKKELRVLNLSGTNLCRLPTTIAGLSNLSKLLLKNCPNLEALPNIQKLTNLEVFDVSGCSKLHTVKGSFVDMPYLHEVNLRGTKVETPEFPKESKIRCQKHIILGDERPFQGGDWSQVMKAIEYEITGNSSSSDAVSKSQEISEKKSGEDQLSELA